MTTRVAEALTAPPSIQTGQHERAQWPPAALRREAALPAPMPRPPEQEAWAEGVETRAIEIVEDMFARHGVVNHPTPERLRSVVEIEAKSINEFNATLSQLSDFSQRRQSTGAELDKLFNDICDVAYPRAYIRGLGKQIITDHRFDNGHRNALVGIRDKVSPKGEYHHSYAALDAMINSSVLTAIKRGDSVALSQLCEVIDIVSPKFNHPCTVALEKGLNALSSIMATSESNQAAVGNAHDPRRSLISNAEFSDIANKFDAVVLPHAQELLPKAVANYQVLGAGILTRLEKLKEAAPEDDELHEQCNNLAYALRLKRPYEPNTAAFAKQLEACDSGEPIVAVFQADIDTGTGTVTGGHTDLILATEAERRGWKSYVVPIAALGVASAVLAGGIVGANFVGDKLTAEPLTDAHSSAKQGVNVTNGAGTTSLGSPDVLDHATATAPLTTPEFTNPQETLESGEAGAQQSEEYTHHEQNPIDDFQHVGQLPEAGSNGDVGTHYVTGNTISAQESKLNDALEMGSLNNAAQATVDLYAHTTDHGRGFKRPPIKYMDTVVSYASRLDKRLKNKLEAGVINHETYIQQRTYLADSIAMLMSSGAASHAHGITRTLPDGSQQAVDKLHEDATLLLFSNQPSFTHIQKLFANTLDVIDPPQTVTTTPGGGESNGFNGSEESGGSDGGEQGGGQGDGNQQGGRDETENNGSDSTHEASANISDIQSKALDKMESMGPDWHNRALVMRGLMEKGWTPLEISGIIGSASVESAGVELDPTTEQFGGGPGRGIIQWGSTVQAFDRFGFEEGAEKRVGTLKWYAAQHNGNWDNLDIQIGFIDWELRNSEKSAGDALRNATSPAEAADIIVNQYERPHSLNASRELRSNYANATYYTLVMLSNQAQLEASGKATMQGPQIKDGMLPTDKAILDFLADKYSGNENGLLTGSDLETIGKQWGDAKLYPVAAEAFRQMAVAFEAEFGKPLELSGVIDAFRPFQAQIDAYTNPDKIDGRNPDISTDDLHLGAEPGTSNHGYGLAVDLASGVNEGFDTPENKWVMAHGPEYGFTKEPFSMPGGSKPEAWHFYFSGGVKIAVDGPDIGSNGGQNGHETSETGLQNIQGPVSQSGYGLPVPVDQYTIGTKYLGYSNSGDGNAHTGLDILAKKGSPALAIRAGKVIKAAFSDSSGGADPDGAGNYIIVEFDNGKSAVYEHLDAVNVKEGQVVKLGDVIGKVGSTGRVFSSTGDGTHLHLEANEEGFNGIASHSETIAQVEAETFDPLDVLPSLALIGEYEDEHGMERTIGHIIISAAEDIDGLAEGLEDTTNEMLGNLPTLPDELVGQVASPPDPSIGGGAQAAPDDSTIVMSNDGVQQLANRLGSLPH